MNQFMGIIIAFLVFSFIVFIHELGHFLLARRGGIGVEEFAVGMGPKIWSIKRGETVYSIRILPIGGFCAMLGEDSAGGGMSAEGTTEAIESDPRAFNNRPLMDRFLAILAGPFFNFILAFLFAIILIVASGSVSVPVISKLEDDFPAAQSGMQVGDKILKINGNAVLDQMEATTYINVEQGNPVTIEVLRKNEKMEFTMTPKAVEANGNKIYFIGIGYESIKPNFFEVIYYAGVKLVGMIKITFFTLGALISGKVSFDKLSGPVGIVNSMSKSYGGGLTLAQFIIIFSSQVVLLSANLGVMNLLPIPALDGGRLVFLAYEAIAGKPVDPKKEGYIHMAGFILLMLLMVVVFYSDIMKLFA